MDSFYTNFKGLLFMMQVKDSFIIDIDGLEIVVNSQGSIFDYGDQEVLVNENSDIAYHTSWYPKGYKVFDFLSPDKMDILVQDITNTIKNIVAKENINVDNFSLEQYHHYVEDDQTHFNVAKQTRDLYEKDFRFAMQDLYKLIGKHGEIELTSYNEEIQEDVHIIVRINRPHSSDYNPPHKDIYGAEIKSFLNVWIPIAGVNENSTLPIAPSSHLLNESKILRTFEGGIVDGKKYRVVAIAKWDDCHKLTRAEVKKGQCLIFTPYLIHGCGYNNQDDTTRVALEFRLSRK